MSLTEPLRTAKKPLLMDTEQREKKKKDSLSQSETTSPHVTGLLSSETLDFKDPSS